MPGLETVANYLAKVLAGWHGRPLELLNFDGLHDQIFHQKVIVQATVGVISVVLHSCHRCDLCVYQRIRRARDNPLPSQPTS